MDVNVENKTNKKGLIVTLALVAVLIIGLVAVSLIYNKPKNIFLKNINDEYKKINSLLAENEIPDINSISSSLDFDFNINVNELFKSELSEEDIKLLDEINALNFKMDMSADKEKQLFNLFMDIKYDKDSLINFNAYGKPNSVYFDLKDLYDKYIEIPVEEYATYFEEADANVDDIEYLMERVKDALLNNLDSKDFSKSSEKISVNEEDIKVTKVTYTLTEYKLSNILINVLKELKEDSKFMDKISTLSNTSVDELKKEFDEMINQLNEELKDADTKDELLISMYTKGIMNEAIKYSIQSDDEVISYTNYKDVKTVEFKDSETTYLVLTNVENEDETYKTEITMDTVKITIDSKIENNTWTNNYKLVESESMMQISGEYTYKIEEVNKEEYKEDLKFTMSIGASGLSIINMDITAKGTTKYNEEVSLPDLSNKVLYTELTEEDANKILMNLMSNEKLVNFINTIDELSAEDSYDDYEDDYDYDYEEL
ncbi:MAG: hypothetical protein J6B98_05220 [Bacilli bacterium]|nr:hypothetical protein [Bacilli bacterium]